MELDRLAIREINELLVSKQLSVLELTHYFINKKLEIDPKIKAWAYFQTRSKLIKKAQSLDNQKANSSPLFGIPYGVKDIIYTKNMPTVAGSKTRTGFHSQQDATIITKLTASDAMLFGKTTTTEFASGGSAPDTRNPWNQQHTPGGSSTGSAAAVASGMSLFSIGTQTSGSIIRPAAYNGVTALKPSFGKISKAGIIPASWSLDTVGIIAKSVEDLVLVYNQLNGPDSNDDTTRYALKEKLSVNQVTKLEVGVLEDNYFVASNEIMLAFYQSIHLLEKLGFRCRKLVMPSNLDEANKAHEMIVDSETAAYHKAGFPYQEKLFSQELKQDIKNGLSYSATDYLMAQSIRWDFKQRVGELFKEVDILVTPATPTTAPIGLSKTGSPTFNKPFSNAGLPVLTLPISHSKQTNLPIGIQFIANTADEQKLIRIGQAFQSATDFHLKYPEIK